MLNWTTYSKAAGNIIFVTELFTAKILDASGLWEQTRFSKLGLQSLC